MHHELILVCAVCSKLSMAPYPRYRRDPIVQVGTQGISPYGIEFPAQTKINSVTG